MDSQSEMEPAPPAQPEDQGGNGSGGRDVKNEYASVLDRLRKHRSEAIDTKRMAQALLKAFGGYDNLARKIHAEYKKSREGSMARSSLLKSTVDIIAKAFTGDTGDGSIDITDDELEAAAREVLSGGRSHHKDVG